MRNFGRSTRPASPGNIFVAIQTSNRIAGSSNERPAGAFWTKPRRMRSPGAGGCDFAHAAETTSLNSALWAAHALPSVIALTGLPPDLADTSFQLLPLPLNSNVAADGPEHLVEHRGIVSRIYVDEAVTEPPAVLLPLDQFFEIRAISAVRLWRGLTGRHVGRNPAAPSKARRDRFVLGLRALDGRHEHASYRDIAGALFGAGDLSERSWKTHDLRDRTIRIVRFALGMMQGGYRRLLLNPYRRRS
jgi:hypothetical protein